MAELAIQYGAALSFARAADLLGRAIHTRISPDVVRRLTEAAGAGWCQLELDLLTALETTALTPGAPSVGIPGQTAWEPETTVSICLDGAMVPLVGDRRFAR